MPDHVAANDYPRHRTLTLSSESRMLVTSRKPPTSLSGIAPNPETPRRTHGPHGCDARSWRRCWPRPPRLPPGREKLPVHRPWESRSEERRVGKECRSRGAEGEQEEKSETES